jgi:hypothetical protein
MVVAAPAVIVGFFLGPMFGVGAIAVMALVTALASAEDATRMAVAGRPLRSLGTACIAALAAFALMEQIGTAILEPPTAWAMLVVLVVSLGMGSVERREDATRRSPANGNGRAGCGGLIQSGGLGLGPVAKFSLMLLAMALGFAYVKLAWLPFVRERALIQSAITAPDIFEADEALRAAAEVNPLAWEPAFMRGRTWQQMAGSSGRGPGQTISLERAAEAYNEALARRSRLRLAWLALADCRLMPEGAAADPVAAADALEFIQEAARLYPTSPITRLREAALVDRLGDKPRALTVYRRALELDALLPAESRRLSDEERAGAAARVLELEESLAAPAASP